MGKRFTQRRDLALTLITKVLKKYRLILYAVLAIMFSIITWMDGSLIFAVIAITSAGCLFFNAAVMFAEWLWESS